MNDQRIERIKSFKIITESTDGVQVEWSLNATDLNLSPEIEEGERFGDDWAWIKNPDRIIRWKLDGHVKNFEVRLLSGVDE